MKITFIILASFLFNVSYGQTPYSTRDTLLNKIMNQYQFNKDRIPYFFEYATTLYRQDSLKKAGQIFYRIYHSDSTSCLGIEALKNLIEIENKVILLTQHNLNQVWNWVWSGTNWGPSDQFIPGKKTKRMEMDGSIIKFYRNDTLIRETGYTLSQSFFWLFESLTNSVIFHDTKEEWIFSLTDFDKFTSNRLWIQKKSNFVCGNYGECYTLK